MARRKSSGKGMEMTDVDAILRRAEEQRERTRRKALGQASIDDYAIPYGKFVDDDDENESPTATLPPRQLNIGTEKDPHNRTTSSRQRKAARAAVTAARQRAGGQSKKKG